MGVSPHATGVSPTCCVGVVPPPSLLEPQLTRQLPSSSARRMMVPHFFPGMPLPGGDMSRGGGGDTDTHTR